MPKDKDVETETKEESANGKAEVSNAAVQIAKKDDASIGEWFDTLNAGAQIKVKVTRVFPKSWRNRHVAGLVMEVDNLPNEEDIFEQTGGGRFALQVQRIGKNGNWVYAGQRTIEIAGDPKITGTRFDVDPTTQTVSAAPSDGELNLQKHVLDMSQRLALSERERADKLSEEVRKSNALDPVLLAVLTDPMKEQGRAATESIKDLQRRLDERDQRMMEMITRPKESSTVDRVIEKMLMEDNARINAIRTQHDSEIRTIREQARDDMKRSDARSDELLRDKEKAHAREIDSIKLAMQMQVDTQKIAFENRCQLLQSELDRCRQEFSDAKKELGTLRDKKDQPIEEQMQRMVMLKEAMDTIMGGNEEQEGSVVERILGNLMESPLAQGIAQRISEAPPTPGQKRPPGAPQQGAQGVQTIPKPALPPRAEVKTAIGLVENAIRNETDPVNFASTARSLLPGSIINEIAKIGIDKWLESVAKLEESSPINSMAGRSWLRKVAKILTEGEAPEPTTT